MVHGAHFKKKKNLYWSTEQRDKITAHYKIEWMHLQSARRCIFALSVGLYSISSSFSSTSIIDWLIWSADPCETLQHRSDSFICSPKLGDSRVPAARVLPFVCPCVHVECVLHVCVMCLRVGCGSGVGGWVVRGVWGCVWVGGGVSFSVALAQERDWDTSTS